MHEYSLAQALLDSIERVKEAHGGGRLTRCRVEVGELAGVEAELLSSALEMLLADGPDAGAVVELEPVRVEARCAECRREFVVEGFHFLCPQCGGGRVEVQRGESVILRDVTLEQPAEVP